MKKYSPKAKTSAAPQVNTANNTHRTQKPSSQEAQARKPFADRLPGSGNLPAGVDQGRYVSVKPTGHQYPQGHAQPLREAGTVKDQQGSDKPLGPDTYKSAKPGK